MSSDPAHWFATQQGLIRVYQEREKPQKGKAPPADDANKAGASCEVVESRAREGDDPGLTRESCTMIVNRMPKNASRLSYELRKTGIFMVSVGAEGGDKPAAKTERLLLPAPIKVGKKWTEKRGKLVLERTVKSAGKPCKAAGRAFGDCLVLAVTEKEKAKVKRKLTETYAAGVGLVEDGQWELMDLKGL